ncbi:MAG TPA: T9SS type A sorting domain-containing protein [Bacteroidales bacterium]|nr:T9SS type A sorting domain-containing protein [Bacteroidales bacterium]HRX96796.1 T9SS type A sorting domain-containing protein [Bacteroidales bacterium]
MKKVYQLLWILLFPVFLVGQNAPVAVNDTIVFEIIEKLNASYKINIFYEKHQIFHSVNGTTTSLRFQNNNGIRDNINNVNNCYDTLNVNNISALVNCFGNEFWDLDDSHFIAPKSGTISSIHNSVLLLSGLDEENNTHVAAEFDRGRGINFWSGPVSNVYDSLYDARWFHTWKLNRKDVQYHQEHWWETGYNPPENIITWPGNGDTENGQLEQIAPFFDANGNGIYEPMMGDAPRIKGDQAIFFVYNDSRDENTECTGPAFGIEIHATAYAFDEPSDSALWNTVFFNYKIVNRSDTNYHDVYIGLLTDIDIGYAKDDRFESDVSLGMFFNYNGEIVDGDTTNNPGYGINPPAQGVLFLGGPLMTPDGIDNPRLDNLGNPICSEAFNGFNFGDGIPDNERLGLSIVNFGKFYEYWYEYPSATKVYSLMKGYWENGTPLYYGGNGAFYLGAVGPECKYVFPRDTDPVNWGTNCIWPNAGYNQNGLFWTDEDVNSLPNNTSGIGTVGPFDLNMGESVEFDVAFPWARAYDGNPWSSALLLKERAAYIREKFQNDPEFFSGVKDFKVPKSSLTITPNPVSEMLRVTLPGETTGIITIFNSMGVPVLSKSIYHLSEENINVSSLEKGIYILILADGDYLYRSKFIKM